MSLVFESAQIICRCSFSLMLKKSINLELLFKSSTNSILLSLISAGSKKCKEFLECSKTYLNKSVPLKFDAQFVKTTPDEEPKTDSKSSSVDSMDSGPKLLFSPTSLNITFETEKEVVLNSKIVVKPCFPFLICRFICGPNFLKTAFRTEQPTLSATVKRSTFAPSLARQYATLTALPPFMSTLSRPRMLPPPTLILLSMASVNV